LAASTYCLDGEWIDEAGLQQDESCPDLWHIAEAIGIGMRNSDIQKEFLSLYQIIKNDDSGNRFLAQLVKRKIAHHRRPKLAHKENDFLAQFIKNQISFSTLIEEMREALDS
jgi:hypothetical protein